MNIRTSLTLWATAVAVLGIEQTRERHAPDTDLREIAEHLTEAERHVEIARRLAARWSE